MSPGAVLDVTMSADGAAAQIVVAFIRASRTALEVGASGFPVRRGLMCFRIEPRGGFDSSGYEAAKFILITSRDVLGATAA